MIYSITTSVSFVCLARIKSPSVSNILLFVELKDGVTPSVSCQNFLLSQKEAGEPPNFTVVMSFEEVFNHSANNSAEYCTGRFMAIV